MKSALVILTIILVLFNTNSLFSQSRKVNVIQYENCESIKEINFDTIWKNMPRDMSISIIVLRAEASHHNGVNTITPIDNYLTYFDTSFVHISSFELKYTKGANSCAFNFTLNGTEYATKGIPPFLCLTSADSILLDYIKKEFSLTIYSKDNRYLLLSGTYNSQEEFFSKVNQIISRYNAFFLLNYLNRKNAERLTIKKRAEQFGFNIGTGTFLEQLKKDASLLAPPPNQSYKSTALSFNISGFYKRYITEHVFIKGGFDLVFFNTEVHSKSILSYPVAAGYSLKQTNPIAASHFVIGGLSLSAGYHFIIRKKFPLNIDLGILGGKMLYGSGKASFEVRQENGMSRQINNSSDFNDYLSVSFITNPTIELPVSLNKRMVLQVGILGMWGMSMMNTSPGYQLVDANAHYHALENATNRIIFENVGLTAGVIYHIN